ncbi:MAG: hypothetical protein GX791_08060 [Synergistaceae bacterium]|nr:hypothetical protein [Synergistaceae bacterium]
MTNWKDALDELERNHSTLSKKAVKSGLGAFFAALPPLAETGNTEVEGGSILARQAMADSLLPDLLSHLPDGVVSEERTPLLLLRMGESLPSLHLPLPEGKEETPHLRTALAAALGALGGMALLTPLARLLLDSRDAGLFFGAPLGALLLVFASLLLPKSKGLQRTLMALLGFASLRETVNFLGGGMIFSRGWALLGKRRSSLTRLLLYPALFALLLLLGRKRVAFDRKNYEERIRDSLEKWINGAIPSALLAVIEPSSDGRAAKTGELPLLAGKILELEELPAEDLPAGVAELALSVRNMGFQREKGVKSLIWSDELADRYALFGAVEPGDRVTVEREHLLQDGVVLAKGLVRKVRRK